MDGHSGSDNDDAYVPEAVHELCDSSDDNCDEPEPRPRFRIPSSQWNAEKMRAIEEEQRSESESGKDEGQGPDDVDMPMSRK